MSDPKTHLCVIVECMDKHRNLLFNLEDLLLLFFTPVYIDFSSKLLFHSNHSYVIALIIIKLHKINCKITCLIYINSVSTSFIWFNDCSPLCWPWRSCSCIEKSGATTSQTNPKTVQTLLVIRSHFCWTIVQSNGESNFSCQLNT